MPARTRLPSLVATRRGVRGIRGPMPIVSDGKPAAPDEGRIRVAAAGDIHCGREGDLERWSAAFGTLESRVDVVLLAGDLTTHGEPEQAAIVAQAAGPLRVPVLTVLGNHDWHANRAGEITAALAEGGVPVLDSEHRLLGMGGPGLGVAGAKGLVGGYPGTHIPEWGEPLLRQLYAESMAQ